MGRHLPAASLAASLLISTCASAGFATPPIHVVAGSGWSQLEYLPYDVRSGAMAYVGADVPIKPWCALGGEITGYRLGSPRGIGVGFDTPTYNPSAVVTVLGSVRFETTGRKETSLFLVTQTGLGFTHWGDVHVIDQWPPWRETIHSAVHGAWCFATGAGVRIRAHHPWPGAELGGQLTSMVGPQDLHIIRSQLAILY